jgi:hypothetical protein
MIFNKNNKRKTERMASKYIFKKIKDSHKLGGIYYSNWKKTKSNLFLNN